TIKNNSVKVLRQLALRDCLADQFRRDAVCMRFSFAEQQTLSGRCGGDCPSSIVIDHLRINMLPGKMNRESGPLRRARDSFSDPSMNALLRCLTNRRHPY